MKSTLYGSLKTSAKLESEGVWLDLGHSRIRLARAGGANQKFNAAAERIARDHKRTIQLDLMSTEKGRELVRDLYTQTVIVDWLTADDEGTLDDDGDEAPADYTGQKYTRGLSMADGEIGECNIANVTTVLTDLPDLLLIIKDTAESLTFYRRALIENITGN